LRADTMDGVTQFRLCGREWLFARSVEIAM